VKFLVASFSAFLTLASCAAFKGQSKFAGGPGITIENVRSFPYATLGGWRQHRTISVSNGYSQPIRINLVCDSSAFCGVDIPGHTTQTFLLDGTDFRCAIAQCPRSLF